MDVYTIRRADPSEGQALRAIAAMSKQHWGYDPARVAEWAARLDLTPATLQRHEHHVAEAGGQAIAFAALHNRRPVCVLDHLWVIPEWIGHGVGTRLFGLAMQRAGLLGATQLEWEADPHAVGFYQRMGGQYLRPSPQNEWGRILPIMGMAVAAAPHQLQSSRLR